MVSFYAVFKPETVEETLLLNELEKEMRHNPTSEWDNKNFIVYLTQKVSKNGYNNNKNGRIKTIVNR